MKVVDFFIETKVSKKGNEYTALYCRDENGNVHFVTYIK